MCNVPLVQKLNAGHNLVVELETLTLREPVFCYDIIKQFTTTGVLHDQINVALRLDDLIEFDYVLVPNALKNFDLANNSLYVSLVRDPVLLQNLNCYELA